MLPERGVAHFIGSQNVHLARVCWVDDGKKGFECRLIIEKASEQFSPADHFFVNLRFLKADSSFDRFLILKVKSVLQSYLLPKNSPVEIRAAEMIMDVKEFERRLNIATLLLMWCDGKTICQFFEDYKQSFFVLLASSQKEVTMAMKTVLHQFFICGADMAPHYEVFHSFFVDTEALKRFYEIDNIESEREFISFFVKTFYLPIFHFIESNCFLFISP